MSIRDDFLERRLDDYLDRRTMPRGFSGKPELIDTETDALHRCVRRFAPMERYDEWFNLFEEKLAEDAKTRAWPTEGEIKAAAQAIRPSSMPTGPKTGFDADPLEIAAKRMNAGDPVAETYVCGNGSDLLQRRGMVPSDVMESYRFGSVQNALATYRHDALQMSEHRHGPVVKSYFDRLVTKGNAASNAIKSQHSLPVSAFAVTSSNQKVRIMQKLVSSQPIQIGTSKSRKQ